MAIAYSVIGAVAWRCRRQPCAMPAGGLRAATVEDTRDALERITGGMAETSARQLLLRVKSLLGYAHRLGYAPFNAGATIKTLPITWAGRFWPLGPLGIPSLQLAR